MLAIKDWLKSASYQLSDTSIPTSRLDAEIILAYTLGKNRTYLHTHGSDVLDAKIISIANKYLAQRLDRVPIAYIIGYKEFYGRQFITTPAVLIPRPESESIIDILKKILLTTTYQLLTTKLIDVGTGSGCLGITAKLEFPALDVILTDVSTDALKVATLNAKELSADVATLQSDLLQNYTTKPDIIIANLPYVDQTWERSPETNHEPALALFADNHGQSIIEKMIVQASDLLTPDGFIIIEADPSQHSPLIKYAEKQSLTPIHHLGYAIAFRTKNL
jgi:release factor glutamine methyltransferase